MRSESGVTTPPRRRVLEVGTYFAIAIASVTAMVLAIVWYVDKYPDAPPPDGAAFALICTPLLFLWLVKRHRRWVRSAWLWLWLALLLGVHIAAYWKFVMPVRPFPMLLFLVLWVMEAALLDGLTDWAMLRIHRTQSLPRTDGPQN